MASYEKRGNAIRAIVRLPGGGKRSATFDTKAEAQAWAEALERSKAIGELRATSAGMITVGQMFEAYLEDVAGETDSAKWNELRIASFIRDPLSEVRLSQVLTHDVNEFIRRRMSTPSRATGRVVAGSTVNRELNLMSAAFTYAIKTRKWIKENPCHACNRPPDNPPRDRALLTKSEIDAICHVAEYTTDSPLTTIDQRVGACFLLALETGMRSGEILRLRPIDYKKDKRIAHVAAIEKGGRKGAKSGRNVINASRNVPLTVRAMEILDQLLVNMPEGQPYIVGLTDDQRDSHWRKCRDLSGVEGLTFHDTKHEAATRLSKYIDVLELSHAIGTKNVRLIRDTYYNDDASRSAARLPERLADHAPS